MITSKKRAKLRSIANNITPIFQIGKGGINDNLIQDLSNALDARELIKLTVLKNSEVKAKDIINDLCKKLNAEPISAIGNKITIYRYSTKEGVNHIELWEMIKHF